MRKMAITTAAVLATAALMCATAFAHTGVVDRSPNKGAKVGGSIGSVSVTFSQPIRGGSIRVYRVKTGRQVSTGSGGRDSSSVRRLTTAISGRLAKGKYSVGWRMTAADGHTQHGTWKFRVK